VKLTKKLEIPKGFEYRRDFLSVPEEEELIQAISTLEFHDFKFQGYLAKRKIISYGYHYSFESFKLSRSEPIPDFLSAIRQKAADWIQCGPEDFAEALITQYPAGSSIGWHKDVAPFEKIVGISLRGFCKMKLRNEFKQTFVVPLEERSAYLLAGEAREKWEHHIPLIKTLRYSITFRTLRPAWREKLNNAHSVTQLPS
jgi:alkylated DNA repair dioxygenase AlkB